MSTNDSTGEMMFNPDVSGVTFSLDKLYVSGTLSKPEDVKSSYSIEWTTVNKAYANDLIKTLKGIYLGERMRQGYNDTYTLLTLLADMSANNEILDIKSSLGLAKYTPVRLSETSDVITTLRAVGNIAFGNNVRTTQPFLLEKEFVYKQMMIRAGKYNQAQNHGNGYNSGWPFYGEHTYSGTFIYFGYFGKFPE